MSFPRFHLHSTRHQSCFPQTTTALILQLIQLTNSPKPILRIQRQEMRSIAIKHARPMRRRLAGNHAAGPRFAAVHASNNLHLRAVVPARALHVLVRHEAGHQRAPHVVHLRRPRQLPVARRVQPAARAPRSSVVVREHVVD